MSDLLSQLAGVLRDLDDVCRLDAPVAINDLITVFKRHAKVDTVTLVPARANLLSGLHLGNVDQGRVSIIYQRCEMHHSGTPDASCPSCLQARYEIAKELAHTLDGDHEKTSPDQAADKLLQQVAKRAFEGPQAKADSMGGMCALELLARFRQRLSLYGGSGRSPSLRLQIAIAQDNYSELARQFGVPPELLKHAFSDEYMHVMRIWRSVHGLSNELPEF